MKVRTETDLLFAVVLNGKVFLKFVRNFMTLLHNSGKNMLCIQSEQTFNS